MSTSRSSAARPPWSRSRSAMEANSGSVAQPAARGPQPYGEVFDRGYQHYTGPRQGRQHAIQALILYSIKRGLGVKKKWTSKIIPIVIYALAYLPALITISILSFVSSGSGAAQNFSYPDLNGFIQFSLL